MKCVAPERVANLRNRVLIVCRFSGNICVKIIHYAILNNLNPVHTVLHNFVTIIFNIILPLNFMSFECYHCTEPKRILISNKLF